MRFANKDMVTLGGSSGIGLAVAHAALEEGGRVSIASSRQETIDKAYGALKADYPAAKFKADAGNVADEDALDDYFKAVGPFDHLVHTAGEDLPLSPIADKDLRQAHERFEICYWGAFAAAKHGFAIDSLPKPEWLRRKFSASLDASEFQGPRGESGDQSGTDSRPL